MRNIVSMNNSVEAKGRSDITIHLPAREKGVAPQHPRICLNPAFRILCR